MFFVDYLPQQRQVVSCDGSVHVWNPETGHSVRQFELGRAAVTAVAYSPRQNVFLAGTTEGTVKCVGRAGAVSRAAD